MAIWYILTDFKANLHSKSKRDLWSFPLNQFITTTVDNAIGLDQVASFMPARVKWNIKPLLEKNSITAYTLAEQADLHRATVYEDILKARASGLKFEVLGRILSALEVLLERKVGLEEIIEVEWED
jgi:DNA-binding Xre family transcriptional regulator